MLFVALLFVVCYESVGFCFYSVLFVVCGLLLMDVDVVVLCCLLFVD